MKHKLIRITTIPESLKVLLKDQPRFMSENGFEVICISSPGKALEELQISEGVQVQEVAMTRKITPFKDLLSLFAIFKILLKEKPLIVHSHTPKAGLLTMIAAKIACVPIRLHTVAGMPLMETKGLKRFVLLKMEKLTYLCSTKIYPNSIGLKSIILKNKLTHETKIKVILNGSSNGIDTNFFDRSKIKQFECESLKEALGIKPSDFVYIFVGRLVGDKGINELIEVFNDISSHNKDVKLILVGDYEENLDPLNSETKKIIKVNSRILGIGFKEDVRPYFAISSCLVFPSYREGFPNVVMQAGAMGLPSIVTDINGCNEIILEGKNGIVVPPKNKIKLKQAMLNILHQKDSFSKMADISRELILERYERKVFFNTLLVEYKELISKYY